jgi:hypothetical protein
MKDGFTRAQAVVHHAHWLFEFEQRDLIKKIRVFLKGKNVICYCNPLACHGDILVHIANHPDWDNIIAVPALDVYEICRALDQECGVSPTEITLIVEKILEDVFYRPHQEVEDIYEWLKDESRVLSDDAYTYESRIKEGLEGAKVSSLQNYTWLLINLLRGYMSSVLQTHYGAGRPALFMFHYNDQGGYGPYLQLSFCRAKPTDLFSGDGSTLAASPAVEHVL